MEQVKEIRVTRVSPEGRQIIDDLVVREIPLTIYLNNNEMITLLCSPSYLDDLAVGFLAAEGFLREPDEILSIKIDDDKGQVWIETAKRKIIAEKTFLKRFITTGCGKGTAFYSVMDAQMCKVIQTHLQVAAETVLNTMKELQGKSELFRETGGVHSAALANDEGIIIFRDDIGRHNAVDKIIGKCFREGINLKDKFLLTTGRLSSEILIKAAKMGIPVLVSRSAPTDLALQLADRLGVTIVGFARGSRVNVYTHDSRIK